MVYSSNRQMFHDFNNACLDPKIIWTCSYLISSQNFEGLHDLFSCVGVSSFPSHEIQEGLKGDVARVIGVNNRHDALEVCVSLKSPNTLVIRKCNWFKCYRNSFHIFINDIQHKSAIKYCQILNSFLLSLHTLYQRYPTWVCYQILVSLLYDDQFVCLLYLSVISNVVSQADQAGLEFFRFQSTCPVLVEMVERDAELIHLVFTDTLRIPCQDLEVYL